MAKSKKKNETKQELMKCCNCSGNKKYHSTGCGYGLGIIGAAIYYISTATSFWIGVLGILKAFVWPAFLVFELLKFLAA
jgi:hypothetical protein